MKEFFSNIETNFLTLTNLDMPLLVDEVMKGDVYYFMMTITTTLDKWAKLIALGLQSKGDLPLSYEEERGPNFSLAKPSKALRSKTTRRRK